MKGIPESNNWKLKLVKFSLEIRQDFQKVAVMIFQGNLKVEVVDSTFPRISETGIDRRVS